MLLVSNIVLSYKISIVGVNFTYPCSASARHGKHLRRKAYRDKPLLCYNTDNHCYNIGLCYDTVLIGDIGKVAKAGHGESGKAYLVLKTRWNDN